jgi:hypothetical protein
MKNSHSSNNLLSLGKEKVPEGAKEAPERLPSNRRNTLTSSMDTVLSKSPNPTSPPTEVCFIYFFTYKKKRDLI